MKRILFYHYYYYTILGVEFTSQLKLYVTVSQELSPIVWQAKILMIQND
jgi:hypothetical protein